jgi:ElaB/YqjD/DUF883 family membrane-anchored ribosome-binding protein
MEKTMAKGNDAIHQTLKKLKEQANAKESELLEVISSMYENLKDAPSKAAEKVTHTANVVNDSVHNFPWSYIGGAALAGFLLGFISRR